MINSFEFQDLYLDTYAQNLSFLYPTYFRASQNTICPSAVPFSCLWKKRTTEESELYQINPKFVWGPSQLFRIYLGIIQKLQKFPFSQIRNWSRTGWYSDQTLVMKTPGIEKSL